LSFRIFLIPFAIPFKQEMPFNPEKLKKLQEKKTTQVRTGGKGSVRRKHKATRKTATHDDKRLKSTLNRLNCRDIPAIEEVNLFKEDGGVVHFVNPKVQASIAANTYVVAGHAETKKLQDLLPGIINQLGPDSLEHLKKVYQTMATKGGAPGKPGAAPAAAGGGGADDEDEVPELVDSFEAVANKPTPAPAPSAPAAAGAAPGGPAAAPAPAPAAQPAAAPAPAPNAQPAAGPAAAHEH